MRSLELRNCNTLGERKAKNRHTETGKKGYFISSAIAYYNCPFPKSTQLNSGCGFSLGSVVEEEE